MKLETISNFIIFLKKIEETTMLITEQLKNKSFTHNENEVCTFILQNLQEIENLSILTIAQETYTSASTTVRLSKKPGFHGWVELKNALIKE